MGSMEFVTNESKSKERSKEDNNSESPINYPVGKPLEVSIRRTLAFAAYIKYHFFHNFFVF